MISTITQLVDQPVDRRKYRATTSSTLPDLVMGFPIKNQYDEKRLRIKKMLQPISITHQYRDDDRHVDMHIHGVRLSAQPMVKRLCETIERAKPITMESYKNILKYNRLSCNSCAHHLRDGVYPMDITCLPLLSNNRYRSDYMYLRSMLEHDEDLPWFSSWSEFNIFMLCPSVIHSTDHK